MQMSESASGRQLSLVSSSSGTRTQRWLSLAVHACVKGEEGEGDSWSHCNRGKGKGRGGRDDWRYSCIVQLARIVREGKAEGARGGF